MAEDRRQPNNSYFSEYRGGKQEGGACDGNTINKGSNQNDRNNDIKTNNKLNTYYTPGGNTIKSKSNRSAPRPRQLLSRLFSCTQSKEKHSTLSVNYSTSLQHQHHPRKALAGSETASQRSDSLELFQHHKRQPQEIADSTTNTIPHPNILPFAVGRTGPQSIEKKQSRPMGNSRSDSVDENGRPIDDPDASENPTSVPLPLSPISSSSSPLRPPMVENDGKKSTAAKDRLPGSPDPTDEMFLPQSSSSLSGSPPPVSLAQKLEQRQKILGGTMKSPGMSIPTPARAFPHPLPKSSERSRDKASMEQNTSAFIDEEDAAAFLPDTYTWDQVKAYVQDSEDRVRNEMNALHQQAMTTFQAEAEQVLQEHGVQWKADAEAESKRMNNLLSEERFKSQQKHHELLNKVSEISGLQQQLKDSKREKQEYFGRIAILEASMQDGGSEDNEKIREYEKFRELYKKEAETEIQELQAQIKSLRQEVKTVERNERTEHESGDDREKQEYKRQVEVLNAQVSSMQQQMNEMRLEAELANVLDSDNEKGTDDTHRQELRDLQAAKDEACQQVHSLKQQLDEMRVETESSLREELLTAKAEKVIAQTHNRELQEQLKQIESDERTEVVLVTQDQLREKQREVDNLRTQLEALKSFETSSPGEHGESQYRVLFSAAQEEIASLRSLLEAGVGSKEEASQLSESLDELKTERDSLQTRLLRIQEEHRKELFALREQTKEGVRRDLSEQFDLAGKNDILQLETELHDSQDQLDAFRKSSNELQSLCEQTATERDQLKDQLLELNKRHQAEINRQKQKAAEELDHGLREAQKRFDNLRLEFGQERNNMIKSFAMESGVLSAQIDEIEQKQKEELLIAREAATKESQEEVKNLRAELESLRCQFESEKKDLIETSANEQDELKAQISEMRQLHQAEFDRTRRAAREELENKTQALQTQLDEARRKFETELLDVAESFEKEKSQYDNTKQLLEQKVKDAEQRVKEEAEREKKHMEKELQVLRNQSRSGIEMENYINEMQGKHKEDLEAAEAKSKKEIEELEKLVKDMYERHTEELEAVETKSKKQLEESEEILKKMSLQFEQEKELLSSNEDIEMKLDELRKSHQVELENVRNQAKGELEKELRDLEEHIGSMEAGDSHLHQKIASLEAKTEADRKEYENQVRQVRMEHNKEVEEMLAQLDLVEAENNERYLQKEKIVVEKDAVISALGSQLADAQSRLSQLNEQHEILLKELQASKEVAENARIERENISKEIEELNASHQKAMAEEMVRREEACDAAREEMIERAEVQFAQANQTYKKLKHEYDTSMGRISSLEREIQSSKKELEEARQKQESREVDLADELAQTKANMATIEANASRKVKQYLHDLEASKETEAAMRQKLDEALTTSRTVQTTLATVVSEKERLLAEHEEMKAVCEELMSMVEGGQQ